MKILVMDHDAMTASALESRLAPLGHSVEIYTGIPDETANPVLQQGWDVIFLDPAPLTNLRPLVMNIRRNNRRTAFVILLSDTLSFDDAVASGFNDHLYKPLDANMMLDKIDNAASLLAVYRQLANDSEDFPSAGGVISKSAFNQLFLSSMDRADRYGEKAHVLFISADNFKQIQSDFGMYEANLVTARLASHLVRLRRQTDIIAQTKQNEYALLLLRPMTESEPVEAAHRFAESLSKCTDLPSNARMSVDIKVSLMRLPTGEHGVERKMSILPPI